MVLKENSPHNSTTQPQTSERKRSLSPVADGASPATKKRSTLRPDEVNSGNQGIDDITSTLNEASNANNDISSNVVELFEEIDEYNFIQDTMDSGQEIDIESFDLQTKTTETEENIPNAANEQTEAAASEPTKATESTSTTNEAKTHTGSNEENQMSGALTTSIPIDMDTTSTVVGDESMSVTATILSTPPTATPTSKKHHPGLTIPDKSCAVRQPFSDKFFFTNEAYEAYSHDSFMANIDSIVKKNKPGLALSLERPPSSSVSRTPSMKPAHQQQRSSLSHGTSSVTVDNTRNNNPSTIANTANNNILDSLLDSISKNDRPAAKPTHVPSDIEIAMQAADLPSTQSQE